jgi:hypothetical protein
MPESQELAQSKERRLESWGEIAAYLRREIRTVQRWEKTLGLPIRRLQVGRQASVYAFPSELDKWYLEREPQVKEDDHTDGPTPTTPPELRPAFPIQAINEKVSQEIPFYKKKATWFGGLAFLVVAGFLVARFTVSLPIVSVRPRVPVPLDGKIRLFVRRLLAASAAAQRQDSISQPGTSCSSFSDLRPWTADAPRSLPGRH